MLSIASLVWTILATLASNGWGLRMVGGGSGGGLSHGHGRGDDHGHAGGGGGITGST